jgi:hypothetical protein
VPAPPPIARSSPAWPSPPDGDAWLHEMEFEGYRMPHPPAANPWKDYRTPRQRLTRPALAAILSLASGNRALRI